MWGLPVVVHSHWFKRGFCFRPFIVMPEWTRGKARYAPYLAHEKAHYARQGFLPVVWVLRWLLSKKFRFREETAAFRAEMEAWRAQGSEPSAEYYAKVMAESYWGMCNFEEAASALSRE